MKMIWNNTHNKLPLNLAKCELKLKNGINDVYNKAAINFNKSGKGF